MKWKQLSSKHSFTFFWKGKKSDFTLCQTFSDITFQTISLQSNFEVFFRKKFFCFLVPISFAIDLTIGPNKILISSLNFDEPLNTTALPHSHFRDKKGKLDFLVMNCQSKVQSTIEELRCSDGLVSLPTLIFKLLPTISKENRYY